LFVEFALVSFDEVLMLTVSELKLGDNCFSVCVYVEIIPRAFHALILLTECTMSNEIHCVCMNIDDMCTLFCPTHARVYHTYCDLIRECLFVFITFVAWTLFSISLL